MSNEKTSIGDRIRKYGKLDGLSQVMLSKKANLVLSPIAKFETGSTPNPTIDTDKKIANALGVSLEKTEQEYRKYQAKTLSLVEKEYLETIKTVQKQVEKKVKSGKPKSKKKYENQKS